MYRKCTNRVHLHSRTPTRLFCATTISQLGNKMEYVFVLSPENGIVYQVVGDPNDRRKRGRTMLKILTVVTQILYWLKHP